MEEATIRHRETNVVQRSAPDQKLLVGLDGAPAPDRATHDTGIALVDFHRGVNVAQAMPSSTAPATEGAASPRRVELVSVDHGGDLMVEVVSVNGKRYVELVVMYTDVESTLFEVDSAVSSLTWLEDGVLAISMASPDRAAPVIVCRFEGSPDRGHQKTFRLYKIPLPGWVVDPMQAVPYHVQFAIRRSPGASPELHLIDIDPLHQALTNDRIDPQIEGVTDWMTDGHGHLRAAIANRDGHPMLLHEEKGVFKPMFAIDEAQWSATALSADGETIYGISNKDRAQRDLLSFEPNTGAMKTVFSKPGTNLDAPLFDAKRKLIGVAYSVNGRRVVEYFDLDQQGISQRLAQAFPGASVEMIDRDDSGEDLILFVRDATGPGRIYHLDQPRKRAHLLGESTP